MSKILVICVLMSCMDWRSGTIDQIDGDAALIEVEGMSLLTVARSCLPASSREGDSVLYVSTSSLACPIVVRGEITPPGVNRSFGSTLERSSW